MLSKKKLFKKVRKIYNASGKPLRSFSFNECENRFLRKNIFKKLQRSFPCKQCQKIFQDRSSLKRHLRFHTSESSVEDFTCKLCIKTFKIESRLKMLMRIHSCERCLIPISYDAFNDNIIEAQKYVENELEDKDGNQNVIFQVF